MSVGVAGGDADRFAYVGLAQGVGRAGGTGDGAAVGLPLVADGTQAVHIGQSVGSGQGLALSRRTGDGHGTRRSIVDVGHGGGGAAGDGFGSAMAVGVAGGNTDRLAHLGLTQGVGAAGSARDGAAVGLPLVADGTQTVHVGQGVGSGQGLAFGCGAGEGHTTCGCVINVYHLNCYCVFRKQ